MLLHHGEGRLVSNNMDNSLGANTDGVSRIAGPHQASANESTRENPVTTCIWTCEDLDYDDQCECVPIPSPVDNFWK